MKAALVSVCVLLLASSALAQVKWVCAGDSGAWSSAQCWTTARVPAATEDVVLDHPSAFTLTALGQDINVNSISLSGAVTLIVQDSTVSASGRVSVDSNAKLVLDTSNEISATEVIVNGTLEWKRAILKANTIINGDIVIDDGAAKELNNAVVSIVGKGKFAAGVLFMRAAAQIVVNPTGSFSVGGAQSIVADVDCVINNAGALSFDSDLAVQFPVLNTGSVTVSKGVTLTFQPPQSKLVVTQKGVVSVAEGAVLALSSSGNSFSSGSTLKVDGSLSLIGDVAINSATPTAINFMSLDKGGKLMGTGDVNVASMEWQSGTAQAKAKLTIGSLKVFGPFPIVLDGRQVVVQNEARFVGEQGKTVNVIFTDGDAAPSLELAGAASFEGAHRLTGTGKLIVGGKTSYSNPDDKLEFAGGVQCNDGNCLILDAGVDVLVKDGAKLSADAGIISLAGYLEHHGNLEISKSGLFHLTGRDKVLLASTASAPTLRIM